MSPHDLPEDLAPHVAGFALPLVDPVALMRATPTFWD